ncbi:MAG: hypothetical protein IKP89_06430 [Bacteroidales bacterium]|jgi:hypothetical protein|nr:hypothetical protein [Bacteroidales bacterium]
MARVFRVRPKTVRRVNNTVLTPEMEVIVTLDHSTSSPFYNDAHEVKAAYMEKYGYDFKRSGANGAWFEVEKLD